VRTAGHTANAHRGFDDLGKSLARGAIGCRDETEGTTEELKNPILHEMLRVEA